MEKIADQALLEKLKSDSEAERDETLQILYRRYYRMVTSMVLKNRGTTTDAEDVFQEGLIALYHNVRKGNLVLKGPLTTYLFAVCRNIWLKERRDPLENKRLNANLEERLQDVSADHSLLELENKQVIIQMMERLGKDCQKLLVYFYYEELTMKEITETMEFSNLQVAKNKKSNCMKKLREMVLEHPALKRELR